jgi:predicted transcriptional regulator
MTKEQIATLFARVEAWPEAAQAELAQVARAIESEFSGEYVPTAGELAGIDRGLRDAEAGRFATKDEIEAVFAKHRRA